MFRLLNYVPMGPAFKDADLSYKAKWNGRSLQPVVENAPSSTVPRGCAQTLPSWLVSTWKTTGE
jgi:hypothetical protein